jgi:hypothetical protein
MSEDNKIKIDIIGADDDTYRKLAECIMPLVGVIGAKPGKGVTIEIARRDKAEVPPIEKMKEHAMIGEHIAYPVPVRPGYKVLFAILVEALDQAQKGKGADRHNLGGAIPFERQRMQTISELIGSVHGMTYQACKKITEGVALPTLERQVEELKGAINYIAGMILFLRKQHQLTGAKTAKHTAADFYSSPLALPAEESLPAVEQGLDDLRKINSHWMRLIAAGLGLTAKDLGIKEKAGDGVECSVCHRAVPGNPVCDHCTPAGNAPRSGFRSAADTRRDDADPKN